MVQMKNPGSNMLARLLHILHYGIIKRGFFKGCESHTAPLDGQRNSYNAFLPIWEKKEV